MQMENFTQRSFVRSAVLIVVGLFIFMLALGGFYTVDQGEQAVVLRYGAAIKATGPGLNFKLPLIDEVKRISTQTRKVSYTKIHTYSRDQQPAELSISINYRMPSDMSIKIYESYGGEAQMIDRLITPRMNQELKNVFGQYNAVTAIQERAKLNTDVLNAITEKMTKEVIIESIQIENIDFSASYEKSIEERMLAEVEVQKVKQNWEREKIQADIVVTKAKAEADAIRLRGDAEAAAIAARGKALRDSPDLVALTQAEKWNGVLPTQMIPSGALPIIGLGK